MMRSVPSASLSSSTDRHPRPPTFTGARAQPWNSELESASMVVSVGHSVDEVGGMRYTCWRNLH